MKAVMKAVAKTLRLCMTLGAAALMLSACGDGSDSNGIGGMMVAETDYGILIGTDTHAPGVLAWLGVPFAKAPVGGLRWKAPQNPEHWTGLKAAHEFGDACLQHGRIYGPGANDTYDDTIATTLNQAVGCEDCLNLNIWRPASTESNLPVIVFFYGGSNVSGYNADPAYNGAELAKKANAVVVSANYRVGIMGWLRLVQFQNGNALDSSGNYGTLDTIKALEYVNENIDKFGGDPGNVTIWGQSAGAVNVFALMASPQAEGLFHKAVPISGGATSVPSAAAPLPSMNSKEKHEMYSNTLLYALVIDSGLATDAATSKAYVDSKTAAEIATFMRGKSATDIIKTAFTPRPEGMAATDNSAAVAANGIVGTPASAPIPEGTVIPVDVIDTFKNGTFNNVPVLVGNTRDEGKLFGTIPPVVFGGTGPSSLKPLYKMSDAQRFMAMKNFDPDAAVPNTTLADQINAEFLPLVTPPSFPPTEYNGWTNVYGKMIFTTLGDPLTQGVAAEAMNALKIHQNNVYYYMFNWDEEPSPWNDVYGAAHGFDLPFLFGNFTKASLFSKVVGGKSNEAGRLALSDAMIASLAAFARTGDPNNAYLGAVWEPWPKQINFDASKTAATITVQ
ncbi:MAG: hypothetical protein VR64_15280 [Desulfatitalea sp. BRH_c12]|nr:MAG: hypothetical protein VR64_15280 [Desulfatitalea sp. BRH_c12]